MRWFGILFFAGLAAALLTSFVLCRKKKEYAAGLNLALTQLIFGGVSFLFLIAASPWTGKEMNETAEWLRWGVGSIVSLVMLAAGIIGAAVSVISLVKTGKHE